MQVFRLPGERSSPTGLKTNNPPCDEVVCGLGILREVRSPNHEDAWVACAHAVTRDVVPFHPDYNVPLYPAQLRIKNNRESSYKSRYRIQQLIHPIPQQQSNSEPLDGVVLTFWPDTGHAET